MFRDPQQLLTLILRFAGGVMATATFATLLPPSWMAWTHEFLGLGAFPDAPLTQYLTRSAAALYAVHGGAMLVTATDIPRFRPVILYFGIGHAAFGLSVFLIDLYAGLPWFWVCAEGPPIMATGLVICLLLGKIRTDRFPPTAELSS